MNQSSRVNQAASINKRGFAQQVIKLPPAVFADADGITLILTSPN